MSNSSWDKEKEFESKVEPILRSALEQARELGIPMVVNTAVSDNDEHTKYSTFATMQNGESMLPLWISMALINPPEDEFKKIMGVFAIMAHWDIEPHKIFQMLKEKADLLC